MEGKQLVTAKVVRERFRIPKSTLYRLVEEGKIPAYPQPLQPWQRQRRMLFALDEVDAALRKISEERPPYKG